jgi:predicted 3-demethylubiquinone-9 3-methyltransferase (glyoxalase superfamily)
MATSRAGARVFPSKRVTDAMMTMIKFDIAELERAYRG